MTEVYVLHHVHELPGGEEDVKLIGVYSSPQAAEDARKRAASLSGFADAPEGFTVDRYRLDEDDWTEGFITVTDDQLLRESGE